MLFEQTEKGYFTGHTMNYVKGTWANDGSIEGLGWLALAAMLAFALYHRKLACSVR